MSPTMRLIVLWCNLTCFRYPKKEGRTPKSGMSCMLCQGFRVTKTKKIKVSTQKKAGRSPKSGSITAMSDHNHVHEVQSICFNLIFGWLYLANGQQYPCIVLCIVSLYRILVSYPIRSVCIVSLYFILVSYSFCTNTCFDRIVLLDISIRIGYIKYTTFLGYD